MGRNRITLQVAVAFLVMIVLIAPVGAQAGMSLREFLERLFPVNVEKPEGAETPGALRPMPVAFCFHVTGDPSAPDLNKQASSLLAMVNAMEACEGVQFGLGLSPSLATALAWTSSPVLQKIRDGLAGSRYVLLGSLFTESAIAALDTWDARLSLAMANDYNVSLFAAAARGFWNSGGVWRQDIVFPVALEGYTHMFIEGGLLITGTQGGAPMRAPVAVSWGGQSITLVPTDSGFRQVVDKALASGSMGEVVDYALDAQSKSTRLDEILVYGAQIDLSSDGRDWSRLPELLKALTQSESIAVTTVEHHLDNLRGTVSVANVAPGQPAWVNQAASAEGFADWNQFNSDDAALVTARSVQAQVRSRIQSVEDSLATSGGPDAAKSLLDWARLLHCWHLRGLGLPGKLDPSRAAEGLKALVPAHAAWQSMHPTKSAYIEDLDGDGEDDMVLVNSACMFVFSQTSGDMTSWFDLSGGNLIAGSGVFGLPAVAASGSLPSSGYTVSIGEDSQSVTFRAQSGITSVSKYYQIADSGLEMQFDITSSGSMDLSIAGCYSLSHPSSLTAGPDVLAYREPDGVISAEAPVGSMHGLINLASGAYAALEFDRKPAHRRAPAALVSSTVVPYGRMTSIDYRLSFAPGSSTSVRVRLHTGHDTVTAPPVLALERRDESLVVTLPSYTTGCKLRLARSGIPVDVSLISTGAAGQVSAPMPSERYSLATRYSWGAGSVVDDAGARLASTGRYEFFPKVKDAQVELSSGRYRVGISVSALIGIVAVGVAFVVTVALAIRKRGCMNK